MTPLKKRFLRHSIAEDRSGLSQSSTPPPVAEKSVTAPSTPTIEGKLDEAPKFGEVKSEADQNGSSMPSRIEVSDTEHAHVRTVQ